MTYFNHMAKHTRGQWHRYYLFSSGQYIMTNERDQGAIDRTLNALRRFNGVVVGEAGPELVNFRGAGTPLQEHD